MSNTVPWSDGAIVPFGDCGVAVEEAGVEVDIGTGISVAVGIGVGSTGVYVDVDWGVGISEGSSPPPQAARPTSKTHVPRVVLIAYRASERREIVSPRTP